MVKIRWRVVIGIVLSLSFLGYALSRVDYKEMATAFSEANYLWTLPMMLSVIITMFIRAAHV